MRCVNCNEELSGKRRVSCSDKCYNSYYYEKHRPDKYCEICDKKLTIQKQKYKRKYCSKSCYKEGVSQRYKNEYAVSKERNELEKTIPPEELLEKIGYYK